MQFRVTVLFVFLICLLADPSPVLAQDLHIFIDAQTNKTRYEYGGKIVKKPKVKKGGNVFIHVENFNNYLYTLDVRADKQDIVVSTNGLTPFTNAFTGGGMAAIDGGADFFPMNSGINEGFQLFDDMDLEGMGFGEGSANMAKVAELKQQFDDLAVDMVKTENQLKAIAGEIEGYKEAQVLKHLALTETEKLKYNTELKPEQIKKLSTEFLQKALEADQPDDLDLSGVVLRSDGRKNLQDKLNTLDSRHRVYKTQVSDLSNIAGQLQQYRMEDNRVESFFRTVQDINTNAKNVESQVLEQRDEILELIKTAQEEDLSLHTALRYEFEAMSANTFSQTFQTDAKNDEINFNVKLRLKDSLTYSTVNNNVQMAAVTVPVFGGVKVNASIGLSFGQFFDRPQDFFIRDSVIFSEDQDSFYPILTSFLHFYPQSAGVVSVGGSVGIGLPMSSIEGLQSASFFFGPSLIIGRGERIVISAGVMGGRVQRLAQGYEVGDQFFTDADVVPVHYPYELGGFLGLSFNLMGTNPE